MIVGLGAAIYARYSTGHDGFFFLTSVTRYPCFSRHQIYNISRKTGYNYLIYVDKNKLMIINNF